MASKKKWFKSAFDNVTECQKTASPKKLSQTLSRTLSSDSFSSSLSSSLKMPPPPQNTDFKSSNWIENFTPTTIQDLAVATAKIQEIQQWLETNSSSSAGEMLFIKGPPGSAKTTTVKMVAKLLGMEISEWVNPVDVDLVRYNSGGDGEELTFRENQSDKFYEFLFKSSRYSTIYNIGGKRLLLVEDFPNIYLKNSDEFNEILEKYSEYGQSPLIFIATDVRSKKLNISYNLFPDSVKEKFRIKEITFNPIAKTLMKKGLNRICSKMSQPGYSKYYKSPTTEIIESVMLAAQGDIRSAVINLHFATQKNSTSLTSESCIVDKKPKKKFNTIGRDETITLMHGLGRVFNPKYTENKILTHSPESLADSFSSEPQNFVSFIYENYISHFREIEDVLEAVDSISRSDIFLTGFRDDFITQTGLNVAIRGVMVWNEKPVGGWKPVRGPKRVAKVNLKDELQGLGISSSISTNLLASEFRSYAKLIKKR